MSGTREHKAAIRGIEKVRRRLVELARASPATYVWRDGRIRAYTLHPTKGWRSKYVETFTVEVSPGAFLMGEIAHE